MDTNLGLKGFNYTKTKFKDLIKNLEKTDYSNPKCFVKECIMYIE